MPANLRPSLGALNMRTILIGVSATVSLLLVAATALLIFQVQKVESAHDRVVELRGDAAEAREIHSSLIVQRALQAEYTITGDDELEAGQEVEVTLGDDGFEADEVVVVSDPDEPPVTNATPTVAPVISSPIYQLSGIIRSIANGDVVLDDVTLTFETAGSGDALQAGQEVEFSVMIESDGRPVITNISPK